MSPGCSVYGSSAPASVGSTARRVRAARRIPYIRNRADTIREWRARAAVGAGTLAVAGLAMFTVHTYVMPLDLLWLAVERKVETRFFTPEI